MWACHPDVRRGHEPRPRALCALHAHCLQASTALWLDADVVMLRNPWTVITPTPLWGADSHAAAHAWTHDIRYQAEQVPQRGRWSTRVATRRNQRVPTPRADLGRERRPAPRPFGGLCTRHGPPPASQAVQRCLSRPGLRQPATRAWRVLAVPAARLLCICALATCDPQARPVCLRHDAHQRRGLTSGHPPPQPLTLPLHSPLTSPLTHHNHLTS